MAKRSDTRVLYSQDLHVREIRKEYRDNPLYVNNISDVCHRHPSPSDPISEIFPIALGRNIDTDRWSAPFSAATESPCLHEMACIPRIRTENRGNLISYNINEFIRARARTHIPRARVCITGTQTRGDPFAWKRVSSLMKMKMKLRQREFCIGNSMLQQIRFAQQGNGATRRWIARARSRAPLPAWVMKIAAGINFDSFFRGISPLSLHFLRVCWLTARYVCRVLSKRPRTLFISPLQGDAIFPRGKCRDKSFAKRTFYETFGLFTYSFTRSSFCRQEITFRIIT